MSKKTKQEVMMDAWNRPSYENVLELVTAELAALRRVQKAVVDADTALRSAAATARVRVRIVSPDSEPRVSVMEPYTKAQTALYKVLAILQDRIEKLGGE